MAFVWECKHRHPGLRFGQMLFLDSELFLKNSSGISWFVSSFGIELGFLGSCQPLSVSTGQLPGCGTLPDQFLCQGRGFSQDMVYKMALILALQKPGLVVHSCNPS